ncbi:MAG: AAA family ATPase [Elusimicrobia bacterium]|nr:AAA family ATPase [Elusimicrobiota bacterium]
MYVFLLGRPGCGKSEIFRRASEKLKQENLCDDFVRVDDFPKLWAIFQGDEKTGRWEHCRKTQDGGYKIIDNTVWDRILKEVNSDVRNLKSPGRIIFVEFSRSNYTSAMKNFSGDVLGDSVIVYIYCSFETCWERNVRRHRQAVEAGSDDHLVSREEMEKTYLIDDEQELLKTTKIPAVRINTDFEGTAHLVKAAGDIVSLIRKNLKK